MGNLIEYRTRPICLQALELACRQFRALEAVIPPAKWIPWGEGHNWRFIEKLPEQLLLQKLARQLTGARTIDLLLLAGHLQEVGALYRMLDEISEDIMFIALGIRTGHWKKDHDEYVAYFWSEDDEDKQPPVRRKNIRAYINRAYGNPDPFNADSVGRSIHKTYSDYMHARSAPIMGMVHGPPARFDLEGIHGADARYPYVEQHPSYFYRCLVSSTIISNVVHSDDDRRAVYSEFKDFEQKNREALF